MTNTKMRVISFIVALAMIVSLIPLTIFASEANGQTEPEISVGESLTLTIPYIDDETYLFVKFVPGESGEYVLYSKSETDPYVMLCDGEKMELISADDDNGLNFSFVYNYTAGETYYFALSDYSGESECKITLKPACDEHTFAYIEYDEWEHVRGCAGCGLYVEEEHVLDEAAKCECGYFEHTHTLDNVEYNTWNHWGDCSICGLEIGEGHVLDEAGKCMCGYFEHTHTLDDGDYNYNDKHHWGNCSICGIHVYENHVFDEAGKCVCGYFEHTHTFEGADGDYDDEYHWGDCGLCGIYIYENHVFDEAGKCMCGYFEHDHSFDIYDCDPGYHWLACSLCGLEDESGEYLVHDYDEEGACLCGWEHFTEGIYLGEKLLRDGEYLDSDGNVTTTAPEGGYAYYKDGTLTLNNFELVNKDKNSIYGSSALYSELSLTLVLIGENRLEAFSDEGIYIASGDVIITGEGSLYVFGGDGNAGIDITGGDLTIDGVKIFVNATDSGIEVNSGDMTVSGGDITIYAGDEGVDVLGDLVITGGSFDVFASNDGFDILGNTTISGGVFNVQAGSSAFEISKEFNISDGIFNVRSDSYSFYGYASITISGGAFNIECETELYEIASNEITIEGAHDDVEIITSDADDCMYIDCTAFGVGDYVGKSAINNRKFEIHEVYVYTGEEIEVKISTLDDIYTLGVDYIVVLPEGGIKELGVHNVKIVGIGDYVGEFTATVRVNKSYEVTLGEETNITIATEADDVWTFVSFTPKLDGTYTFHFYCDPEYYYNIDFMGSDLTQRSLYKDGSEGMSVTLDLEGGVTYYFDVYEDSEPANCLVIVVAECDEHFGGEATYTEQAVCDRCGEHYGQILECPGHTGGEATYTEQAVCEECGEHYGEILECNHMCHKGGIYRYIWKVFDRIYDFLGIETECECGEKH